MIEPVDATLKVHYAPLGVMTNAPTYDWHLTNLQNYVNLSVKDVEGAIGLAWHARRLHAPVALRARGDLQPVRGAERHGRGRRALRLPHLESVRHPERIGAELGHRRPVDEITEWTSVADLKNLRWYFRTFTDQSIHVVDLKEASRPPRASCASSRWKARRNHHRRLDEFVAGK